MAKLYFRYSAMNAGKSTMAMQVAHNYEEQNGIIQVWKPLIDTKGDSRIVSRIGIERKVDHLLSETSSPIEIIKKELEEKERIDAIIVDEAQFLTKKQVDELWLIAHKYNINVVCYALKSNFKGNLFEGSMELLARSDEKHELTVNCSCGKTAMFNARRVNGKYIYSGKEVVIDGAFENIEYIPLCSDCYLEFVLNGKMPK